MGTGVLEPCLFFHSVIAFFFLTVMLEAAAEDVMKQDFCHAVKFGIKQSNLIIQGIKQLAKEYGKPKRIVQKIFIPPKEIVETARR